MSTFDQQKYQVRFDWGDAGVHRIGHGAHVVVVCDELDGHGRSTALELAEAIASGAPPRAEVLLATEASAGDAVARIRRLQSLLGDRAVVAVVAAGSFDADGLRTTVEDLLAAGALIDALAVAGIDFSSPEAAAACAAYQGLRRATSHVLTASVSAQRGAPDARGQRLAHETTCTVLREFSPAA